MAIAFGSVGSFPATPFTPASSTTMAVPYPVGVALGDPLILVAVNGGPNSFSTPSTWTASEFSANVGNIGDTAAYVFTKAADATDVSASSTSGTLTVTCSASLVLVGAMVRYSGAGGFGDTASGGSSSISTTSVANGTLSPAPGANDMVVRCYCWSPDVSGSGESLTNPGGTWTTRLNLITNWTNDGTHFNGAIVIADKISGTDTQNITSSVTGAWFVVDVALTPIIIGSKAVRIHPGRGPGTARFRQRAMSTALPVANPMYGDQLLPYS